MIASGRKNITGLSEHDGDCIARPWMEKTPRDIVCSNAWEGSYCVALRRGSKRAFLAALEVVVEEMGIK